MQITEQQFAKDTLDFLGSLLSNINERESMHEAVFYMKKDIQRYVGDYNDFLLVMASDLEKNQKFIHQVLGRNEWITSELLSKKLHLNKALVTRHLNSLVRKGLARSQTLSGLRYYKANELLQNEDNTNKV